MANCYYEGAGVLVLANITPVIRALFADFDIEEVSEEGEATIIVAAEKTDPSWEAIEQRLGELAKQLNLEIPESQTASRLEGILRALVSHFGQDGNVELEMFISNPPTDDPVLFDQLFDLAQAFNDGHKLKSLKFEASYHSDRYEFGAFGGDGEYLGKHFRLSVSTSEVRTLAPMVDAALERGEVAQAASLLEHEFNNYLAGIPAELRTQVRQELAKRFATN